MLGKEYKQQVSSLWGLHAIPQFQAVGSSDSRVGRDIGVTAETTNRRRDFLKDTPRALAELRAHSGLLTLSLVIFPLPEEHPNQNVCAGSELSSYIHLL